MTGARGARLLVAVAALVAAPPAAAAQTPAERFDQATALIAAGRPADAADAMIALVDAAPADPLADAALFAAGQLHEEDLADPGGAATLYQRLLRDYPDSRTALAASRRLEHLREVLGPDNRGAAAAAAFTDIQQHYSERGREASIQRMEALVAANPEWPGLADAMLWLAGQHALAGRFAEARRRYLEVAERWSDDADRFFHALVGAAEAALAGGDTAAAEALYRRLPIGGDPARLAARDDGLAAVARARLRHRLYLIAYAVLAAVLLALLASLRLAAGSWAAAARALRRPPVEVLYMVPVAAVLVAAALTGQRDIAPAVVIIVGGGVVLTWVSGAGLAAGGARRVRLRALVHAAATATGVIALCWIALQRTHLLDLIAETVRFGPER